MVRMAVHRVHSACVRKSSPSFETVAEVQQRARNTVVNFVRLAFVVVFTIAAFLYLTELADDPATGEARLRNVPWTIAIVLMIGALVVFADILTPRKRISTLVGILVGLAAGMLATWAFGQLIDLLAVLYGFEGAKHKTIVQAVKLLLGVCFVYLAITTVLQTQDDFRLVIPYVEFAKEIRGTRPMLIDSSALIDARFAELAETGVIQSPIVIPSFVVAELQLLADQSEKTKRARGRRGLDIVGKLQRSADLDVSIDETIVPGKGVDQLLIELARRMNAYIVTTDSGLSRVAGIKGVGVVNIHELAASLKPSVSVGDALVTRIVKPGEQAGQGVGYLEDGTMVVVDDARDRIGTNVTVQVTSTLQTAAGRLVFARIQDAEGERPESEGADASEPRPEMSDDAGAPAEGSEKGGTGNVQGGKPLFRRGKSPRNPRR
ncbi:MAG: TRAM domain-containing protein [Phycisphaeraceae bacterium]|nr:TRAM domain-containing protein [Phycisphaeraceae bacterium]